MTEVMIDREAALPAVPPVENLSPDVAVETSRPVRRRRSSPKKASVPASSQSRGERPSEPSHSSGRILADTQTKLAGICRRILTRVLWAWHWLQKCRQLQLASKRLVLCETVSLGEKRFVAIVKVDGRQFLVGAAAGSVSMLSRLNEQDEFAGISQRRKGGGAVQ